jgi:transcription elongation factor GreA
MPTSKTTKKPATKSSKTISQTADIDFDDDGGRKEKIKEISREWYQNLTNELQDLKHNKMPATVERIKEARSYGDLSENAEYEAALEEKSMIESRMMEIESLLSDAVIIDEAELVATKKSDRVVRYGSKVTVLFEWGKTYTFQIVSTGEVKFQSDVQAISFDSPVGAALEGKKIGQIVKVRSEKGRFDVTIVDIE